MPEPIPYHEEIQEGNCEFFRDEFSKYDWDVDTALKISKLESGCITDNHNYQDNHRICRGSYGLMQVGCIHYNGEDINDWRTNIKLAYEVYQKQGWKAWSVYPKIR